MRISYDCVFWIRYRDGSDRFQFLWNLNEKNI